MVSNKIDNCFWNKYIVNTNIFILHDSGVMLLPSTSGHLSVYYGGIISSDLGCFFPLGSYYHLGLCSWGVSLSIEA